MIRTLIVGLALLPLVGGLAMSAEQIGSAFAIIGTVTGKVDRTPVRLLSAGSDVHFEEHIRARAAANGQFRFVDGSRFVVGGGSDVVLDDFVFKGGASQATLRVTKGSLRFLGAGTRPGRDRFTIQTPVATVGIRGTVVDVTHSAGRTAFLLLHGSAQVCRRGGACQLVTEPCTSVVVQSGISDILQRTAADLATDFPLLGLQPVLWPSFRAATTCGVTSAVQPIERSRGRSEGDGGADPGGGGQSGTDTAGSKG